jgi:hypothetical protein
MILVFMTERGSMGRAELRRWPPLDVIFTLECHVVW